MQKVASPDNCSIFYRAKLIIRTVIKWRKFRRNQKIASTLICYIRLMQDSRSALNRSRTVKNPFFKLIHPDFWTDLNSCRQRLLFVQQLNSENVASTRRVGLNQNLKKTWKGLFQIPLSHIWRMMSYYCQNFTIDWVSFLLQFQFNVMAWLCQHFIVPRCHCFYYLSVLTLQTSGGFNRKPFLFRYMTRVWNKTKRLPMHIQILLSSIDISQQLLVYVREVS